MEEVQQRELAKGTLGVLGGAIFVTMLGVGIITPFLPLYARQMGASAFFMGLIFGAFSLSRLLAMPFVGPWSDRRGRKSFIVIGLLGFSLTALLMKAADTPYELILARVFMGVCSAMVLPVSMALVADVTPIGREGRNIGGFNTAFLLGLGMGPLLGGVIYDTQGVATNFVLMAVLSLVAAALTAWRVKEPPEELRAAVKLSWWSQFALLSDPQMLGIFICRAGGAAAMGFFIAFLPVLGVDKGLSNSQVGVLLACNVLVMTGMQSWAGRLADRLPRAPLALGFQLVTGLLKSLLPLAAGFQGLLLLVMLEGATSGLGLPALTALAMARGREVKVGMGVVMGLFTIGLSIGVFSGPTLGGLVADHLGIATTFQLSGACAALSSLALWPQLRRKKVSIG